jgi:hypothetical protein
MKMCGPPVSGVSGQGGSSGSCRNSRPLSPSPKSHKPHYVKSCTGAIGGPAVGDIEPPMLTTAIDENRRRRVFLSRIVGGAEHFAIKPDKGQCHCDRTRRCRRTMPQDGQGPSPIGQ